MARFGFAIDNRACIGCHACTVACKAEHSTPIGVNRTWVKYIEKGTFPHTSRSFSVQRCNHCEDAPCVEICPVTSLYQRPDGIVDFDSDRCIGCMACMQACPYDAIHLDPETLTATKCNYCTHRVDQGYEPACVIVCPVDAIISGDLDDPQSPLAILERTQRVQYPKVEKDTKPKLFYIGGETAALDPTQAQPEPDYLWSAGGKGVTPALLAAAKMEAEGEARARRVYDPQHKPPAWGWMVSAYITTKAIATGTVMVAFLCYLFGRSNVVLPTKAAVVSLLFLGLTGALLAADLKQPQRFLYVLLRPQWRSWLVRGAYLIAAFVPLVLLCAFVSNYGASRGVQLLCGSVASILGVGVAGYTALLFAQAKGRDYWQNPLLLVSMVVESLVAGVVVATVLGLFYSAQSAGSAAVPDGAGLGEWTAARIWLFVATLVLAMLCAAEFLPKHPTRGAALAAKHITRGVYARSFWIGVVGIGIVLPAVILGIIGWAGFAGALLLIGIPIRNHLLVQAPQLVPLS